jgi:hypothetical protein
MIQWALEPDGELGEAVKRSLTDRFALCGTQASPRPRANPED